MAEHDEEAWKKLCSTVKVSTPTQLGHRAWYILIAAALAASPEPALLAEFFIYITKYETSLNDTGSSESLSLQMRDLLLKQTTLVGAPQVLMAFTPLCKAENNAEEKAKSSKLSEKWVNFKVDEIHARGTATIHSIYGRTLLHDKIFPQWSSHTADIQFMELFTVYGLYLSDFTVFNPIETELIVFVTISCLGLGQGPALWHLRGLGRLLGARGSDDNQHTVREVKDMMRKVKIAAMEVVEFVGQQFHQKAKVSTWPNVGDVQRVLGGWGEDA